MPKIRWNKPRHGQSSIGHKNRTQKISIWKNYHLIKSEGHFCRHTVHGLNKLLNNCSDLKTHNWGEVMTQKYICSN